MDLELKGRRALVTGSTAGIGFAIAQGLAAEGARVAITGRTQKGVEDALRRLRAALPGAAVEGIAADCATASGADTVFAAVPDIDILVNNLGIYEVKPFFEIADDDWSRFFETNVLSGVRFPREMIHYGLTKTAQLALSRGLAIELAATGVTVNVVLPGPTMTEGVRQFVEQNAKAAGKTVAEIEKNFFKTIRPSSLNRRFATPEEVANLAVYLCGAGASATTGAALRVDGGVVSTIT
jgi:NAD(P)-dependent dehydrogenase (short-subunit alcohol dehydrogenase family)